jgi:Tfp pilus assembly protein PilF
MSLLIKALDHLDKNKQAEKNKKLTGEYVADKALMLELVPVETEQTTEALQTVEDKQSIEVAVSENAVVDSALSLEEEAGLTGAHIAASKYAKPKPGRAKAIDQVVDKMMTKPVVQTGAANNIPADQAKTAPAFQTVAIELNQKAAAKVFVANKAVKAPSSKSALAILAVVGALLVWLGLQGYGYIKTLTAPDVLVLTPMAAKPSMPLQHPAEIVTIAAPAVLPVATSSSVDDANVNANQGGKTSTAVFNNKVTEKPQMLADAIQAEPKKSRSKKTSTANDEAYSESNASYNPELGSNVKRQPVKLISKAPSSGIDPTLMAAYQAFTRGEDVAAQQQYRQVLQRDVRNVDALLGMAAIAQRQGRDADAAGWYQKVLEIEPKNTIALSVMAGAASTSPQANPDIVGTESRFKSMLAQQPDAANVHAALGNLYAEQSQWPAAQEAYFNASRLAPNNADYAFNLAISLDQMGKSGLALKQYQRALELLNKSGGASPDRAQLEARIRELQ